MMTVQKSLERIRRTKILSEAEGYLELGLGRQALDCLKRLGDSSAFDAHTLYLWGEGLRVIGCYDEAIGPLEQAVRVMPKETSIHLALGWCYKRTGRLDLAIATLEDALMVDASEAVLHYNLACYFSLAGERHRALKSLHDALELEPRFGRLVDEESDFAPLRSDAEFQLICERAQGRAE
jgi:tetratricopeptide (TPR) repeat protein